MLRPLLLAAGCVSLAMGAVGVVLPLLPTTPFLLVAGFCFARSSDRFHSWLMSHPIFGPYIHNFRSGHMSHKDKARTIPLLWASILLSAFLIGKMFAWILLPTIAVCVSIYILRMKEPD